MELTSGRIRSFSSNHRFQVIGNIGFTVLTLEVLDVLVSILKGRSVLEVGAGIGYVAFWLKARGVDITAVDNYSGQYIANLREYGRPGEETSTFQVSHANPEILVADVQSLDIKRYDVILMCWPDQDSSVALDVIESMRLGQTLIDLTEGEDGCIATAEYFARRDSLFQYNTYQSGRLNEKHFTFNGLYDHWGVFHL
jgi:SAM-dependent methyltransferase